MEGYCPDDPVRGLGHMLNTEPRERSSSIVVLFGVNGHASGINEGGPTLRRIRLALSARDDFGLCALVDAPEVGINPSVV